MNNPHNELSKPHSDDCDATKEVENGVWRTPWTLTGLETEWLDEDNPIEYEDGSEETLVAVFRCNDTDCNGKAAVPANKILEQLPDKVEYL